MALVVLAAANANALTISHARVVDKFHLLHLPWLQRLVALTFFLGMRKQGKS